MPRATGRGAGPVGRLIAGRVVGRLVAGRVVAQSQIEHEGGGKAGRSWSEQLPVRRRASPVEKIARVELRRRRREYGGVRAAAARQLAHGKGSGGAGEVE